MRELGRYLYPVTVLVLFVAFFAHVREILAPFFCSAVLAYFSTPLVRRLKRTGLKHDFSVALVFTGLVTCAGFLLYLAASVFVAKAPVVGEQIPDYLQRVETVVNEGLTWLRSWGPGQALGVEEWLSERHEWVLLDLGEIFGQPLKHVKTIAEAFLLIPFLTWFFLLEGPRWWDALLALAPAAHVEMLLNVLMEVEYAFGGYLRGLFLQAIFMGGAAGLGFWAIGLMHAGQIALWVALTSMIPFVGPSSAALAGGAVALFQWGSLYGILKVLGIYLAIRLIDDWFFHPLVMRRAVQLHPIVTVFSLMAGALLYGFWGLIFAIPVVCVVKVLLSVTSRYYRAAYGMEYRAASFNTAIPVI